MSVSELRLRITKEVIESMADQGIAILVGVEWTKMVGSAVHA